MQIQKGKSGGWFGPRQWAQQNSANSICQVVCSAFHLVEKFTLLTMVLQCSHICFSGKQLTNILEKGNLMWLCIWENAMQRHKADGSFGVPNEVEDKG